MFDVTSRKSFEDLELWVAEASKYGARDVPVIVCSNKVRGLLCSDLYQTVVAVNDHMLTDDIRLCLNLDTDPWKVYSSFLKLETRRTLDQYSVPRIRSTRTNVRSLNTRAGHGHILEVTSKSRV